ncbi:MAG TPA: DEAD/DEAH box helicase family protein, partial [Geobacterales bacterium]|nr:DEAD/DEAH box helicase family protein [Geobacterales bacterium]
MNKIIDDFNNIISSKLGFELRKYQVHVVKEVIEKIEAGQRFIIVSMPTGSGKTLLEMCVAYYAFTQNKGRILALEPTRFLCDQMYSGVNRGLWSAVFEEKVGKEYEGNCESFFENKKIIISTPQTALKCSSMLKNEFNFVIIDEAHHAFGGKYYADLLLNLKPQVVIGFTALLPSYKKYELHDELRNELGDPCLLFYDFKKLKEIDPDYDPPKAIADLFDAEFSDGENSIYDMLFRGIIEGNPQNIKFLGLTLARFGKEAFCESYGNAKTKNKVASEAIIEEFCSRNDPSHKSRSLLEILNVYDVMNNDALRPVLVFTSRKATANEFKEIIANHFKPIEERIIVLTSDISREAR